MSSVKRHPVRGFFAGLLVGLGVALLGIVTSQIALGTIPPYICIVVGIVLGVLWAMFGPTRGRRGSKELATVGAPATDATSTTASSSASGTATSSDAGDGGGSAAE
jgi:uncharacterized protein YacL